MYLHLKTIVLFLCFVALANTKPSDNAGELKKVDDRAFWQFSHQVANIFGFDMSLDLLDYGCYCGVGGFGTPVDDLDRCCMVHDKCYDRHNSWWCWPKVVWYSYDFSGNSITCTDETGSCSKNICMCDKAFLECVHGKEYHPKNHDIDTSTCLQ